MQIGLKVIARNLQRLARLLGRGVVPAQRVLSERGRRRGGHVRPSQ
ncbi:hypothetical protein GLA29479_4663 [Lysobacter antibioticus]|nr:hypothetical protein GLA29479_4663 [Lysobacter antibioticus]